MVLFSDSSTVQRYVPELFLVAFSLSRDIHVYEPPEAGFVSLRITLSKNTACCMNNTGGIYIICTHINTCRLHCTKVFKLFTVYENYYFIR